MASPNLLKKLKNLKNPLAKRTQVTPQRRRANAMSTAQQVNDTDSTSESDSSSAAGQPQPQVDPLTRRNTNPQPQPVIAAPAPPPVVNRAPTRDEQIATLQAFLQRPDLPRGTRMQASLDHMRQVVAAHGNNALDEADLRIAMTTMDMILIARQGMVPVADALRQQRGPSLTPDTYKVVVDGQDITSFNTAQIQQLQRACFGKSSEKDTRALGLVMEGFNFNGTMQDLVNLVCAVHRCLPDPGTAQLAQGKTAVDANPGVADKVQELLAEEAAERGELAKAFTDAGLTVKTDGATASQCRALRQWLTAHPSYLTNLRQIGVRGFVFGSKEINDPVGEYVSDKREVHLRALPDKPADAFVRLALHESGHAGFQRALIGETMTAHNDVFTARRYKALRAYVTHIQARAVAARAGTQDPPRTPEIDEGERLWNALSPVARRYYQAWLTLRQKDGEFLIGADQGRASDTVDMDEVNRQKYQATTFIEICAEGFSTFAMGDVDAYDAVIQSHDDVPDEIKAAWTELHTILREVGGPILGIAPYA
ncbi:hypothetical protein ACFO1B_47750 [Dactylosporangium siamense]|uniref:Uncharacterized protein n=1 Tax=Dactylosporangium siamense TaxID=685454 RepID=A0A919PWG2_9ACTN|nr:hypothetical protein [Dactylosporangium siamense]GIG51544.1 hypothetical protein Dsi01nite_095850 [Dactylosporangium siamense]